VALAMFLGPARFDILLRSLVRLGFPFRRHLTSLLSVHSLRVCCAVSAPVR
jgi:hypothetical protein